MNELKNLQASGLTTLGQALRSSFDLLNLNRLVSGIDNYGQVTDLSLVFLFLCVLLNYTGEGFWWFKYIFWSFFSLFFNVLLDNCVLKLDRFDFLSYCVFWSYHEIPWSYHFFFLVELQSSSINNSICRWTVAALEHVHWMAANVIFSLILSVVNILSFSFLTFGRYS